MQTNVTEIAWNWFYIKNIRVKCIKFIRWFDLIGSDCSYRLNMHGAKHLHSFIKSQLNTLHKKFQTHTVKDITQKMEFACITCIHGVMWLPFNWTFSTVPPIDSTRGFKVSSRRSVWSIVSKMNFTCVRRAHT